jgi:hypothetical protein
MARVYNKWGKKLSDKLDAVLHRWPPTATRRALHTPSSPSTHATRLEKVLSYTHKCGKKLSDKLDAGLLTAGRLLP